MVLQPNILERGQVRVNIHMTVPVGDFELAWLGMDYRYAALLGQSGLTGA